MGYGLAAPLYALLPKFSSTVSLLFGVVVVGIMFSNFRFCFTKRLWDIILLNTTLLGCCIFGVYGILQSKWIYTCAFTDSLFQRAWDHRHLFPFIIFSNLQVLFLLGRTAWSRKILFSVGYCAMLTAISLCILHPMYQGAFFTYSLRWSEARKLLKEPYAAMPIPQLMPEWLPSHEFALPQAQTGPYDSRITGMFYSPQCNWGSGGVKASPVENGTAIQGIFAYRHFFAQPERKVKYLLLFPKPEEQVFLPKGTILSVEHGELTLKAELLNPGSRGYYLFVFDKLIPSKYTNEFTIMAPEGYPPQSDFTVFMMGFWG